MRLRRAVRNHGWLLALVEWHDAKTNRRRLARIVTPVVTTSVRWIPVAVSLTDSLCSGQPSCGPGSPKRAASKLQNNLPRQLKSACCEWQVDRRQIGKTRLD